MARDGEDWNGFEMTILKSSRCQFFSKYTNDDVTALLSLFITLKADKLTVEYRFLEPSIFLFID